MQVQLTQDTKQMFENAKVEMELQAKIDAVYIKTLYSELRNHFGSNIDEREKVISAVLHGFARSSRGV